MMVRSDARKRVEEKRARRRNRAVKIRRENGDWWRGTCDDTCDDGLDITTASWHDTYEHALGHLALHHPRPVKPCDHEMTYVLGGRPETRKCLYCGVPIGALS